MAPQEQEPILPKLITDATIHFWSKESLDRPDNFFEGYFTLSAAEDAVQ